MAVSKEVVAVVGFYMAAALVMVFVNKTVLNSTPNLTILFMFFQSLTTVLLLNLTGLFTHHIHLPRYPRSLSSFISPTSAPSSPVLPFPPADRETPGDTITLPTLRSLFPLILIDALGFTFNALCLRSVPAAFYQIARGLVLPLTILIVAISSRPMTRPSIKVVGCASVVTLGFFIGAGGVSGEGSIATPTGLLYGFLSSLTIAVHAVLVKKSLAYVNGSSTLLSYYSNLGSAVLLGLLAVVKGEAYEFVGMVSDTRSQSGEWDWATFAWGNLVTGVFGFLISIAGILSVKVTSPVTHMFSSAARSVLQVVLGVQIFGDLLTVQRATSVFTILVGTLLYTYVKSHEGPNPSSSRPPLAPSYSSEKDRDSRLPVRSVLDREGDREEERDVEKALLSESISISDKVAERV